MEERSYKATILVADDEEPIREILRTFFEGKGYRVETAGEGRKAIDMLESVSPDILLLDLKMPDMDGIEVLKYIDDKGLGVAVVIITGHPDHLRDNALLGRVYDYIVKPFDLDYLNNTVLTKVALLA